MKAAVVAHLKAERRPASPNYAEAEGFVDLAGSQALTSKRGSRALEGFGIPIGDVEALGPKFEGARIAMDLGPDPEKGVSNLVRHIRGQELDMPAPVQKSRDSQMAR